VRNDPYKTIVWLIGLAVGGFGLYWAYQNGMLGYFGQCPVGWTASSGSCVNAESLQTAPAGSAPTTPLAPGMTWGWSGEAWMQVPIQASWNPTVTL